MKAEMEVQARVANQCSQVRTNTQDKDKLQPRELHACIEFSRILNQPEALENEVYSIMHGPKNRLD